MDAMKPYRWLLAGTREATFNSTGLRPLLSRITWPTLSLLIRPLPRRPLSVAKKTTENFLGVSPRTEDLLSIYNPEDLAKSYAPVVASVLEATKHVHKSTRIVATSTVSDATPAAFGSHIDNRGDEAAISMEQLVHNNIDVVLGGVKELLLPAPTCRNKISGGKRRDCQNLLMV